MKNTKRKEPTITIKPGRKYPRVQTPVGDLSLTKQSFKDECDPNLIVKRFVQTGVLPFNGRPEPKFMDAPSTEFADIQFAVANAKTAFERLSDEEKGDYANVEDFINSRLASLEAASDPSEASESSLSDDLPEPATSVSDSAENA